MMDETTNPACNTGGVFYVRPHSFTAGQVYPSPMTRTDTLFQPRPDITTPEADMIAQAIACVEAFTARFNARDLAGMDARLHFPHIILSGEQLVIWNGPGQLPASFFDDLERDTGWAETRYQRKQAVLVSPRKVHMLLDYTRNRGDGSVASQHSNMWIITYENDRWGIKQRSY